MKCPLGRQIGTSTVFKGLPPGECEVCGLNPLHGPRQVGGPCACSFWRINRRLCRVCAVVFDISRNGSTRIQIENLDQIERFIVLTQMVEKLE